MMTLRLPVQHGAEYHANPERRESGCEVCRGKSQRLAPMALLCLSAPLPLYALSSAFAGLSVPCQCPVETLVGVFSCCTAWHSTGSPVCWLDASNCRWSLLPICAQGEPQSWKCQSPLSTFNLSTLKVFVPAAPQPPLQTRARARHRSSRRLLSRV
ncbi:hypothetical protein BD289DRAFT_17943 [Coniella lustricola]|uniref:Uncharacterized protein n=1 Tax=Coniella lustricola TaxID=2025994 RepID=A0A2T3AJA8_9PEZI|nr:hypothetical protein BD289DRAFT_17943 [Coniella lustricola]